MHYAAELRITTGHMRCEKLSQAMLLYNSNPARDLRPYLVMSITTPGMRSQMCRNGPFTVNIQAESVEHLSQSVFLYFRQSTIGKQVTVDSED